MKLISIEPTPNPNSMKLNLDVSLPPGEKHTYVPAHKDRYSGVIRELISVKGVQSIFHAADFMSVQRHPAAGWGLLLTAMCTALDSGGVTLPAASVEDRQEAGEVQVFVQFFRRIPMLVRVTNGREDRRVALAPRFQSALTQAAKASKNMLMERRWKEWGIRYGALSEVGERVAEELAASYDAIRLHELAQEAFTFDDNKKEKKRFTDNELPDKLHSPDWRERFAALEQIGPDENRLDELAAATRDEKMSVRRLAVVYLGLIQKPAVFEPLVAALNDEAVAVRRTAGDALTDLGDERAVPFMIPCLKDSNKLVRWRAARFLFELGDRSALPALKESADDPEFEVRMQLAQAIERIESGQEAQGTVWRQFTKPSGDKE